MQYPIRGYILLPPSPIPGYRGIDRNPFLPTLIEGELDKNAVPIKPFIWSFYPPGWKRDAYRLYEEHLVPGIRDDLDLLSSKEIAAEIKHIIEPHVGPHEITACEIWRPESVTDLEEPKMGVLLGYDIAYLGGDFFSAIKAGIFGSPIWHGQPFPRLLMEYKPVLNEFGLFINVSSIPRYIRDFKEEAPSEENSDFHVWCLWLDC